VLEQHPVLNHRGAQPLRLVGVQLQLTTHAQADREDQGEQDQIQKRQANRQAEIEAPGTGRGQSRPECEHRDEADDRILREEAGGLSFDRASWVLACGRLAPIRGSHHHGYRCNAGAA
jgi:hypothetical protein